MPIYLLTDTSPVFQFTGTELKFLSEAQLRESQRKPMYLLTRSLLVML